MTIRRRRLPILALLGSILLATACRPAPPVPPGDDAVARLLAGLHEQGRFSGAVVTIERGRTVSSVAFGFADHELGVPFTAATAADGGSIAKTFTAAALLSLAAEGRLELDEPANRRLPELPYPQITLRHLITHSSGLPDYDWLDARRPPGEVSSNEANLALIAAARPPLAFAPGTAFRYSNVGFDLAALALERIDGAAYEDLLRSRFLAPLGLRDAFVRPPLFAAWPGARTRGYRRTAGGVESFDAFDREGFYGGGNLYLSARDLARWGAAWSEGSPLPPQVLAAAVTPVDLTTGRSGLTLGNWYRSADGQRLWYPGHHQGFHDVVWWDRSRHRAIGLVTNVALDPDLQSGLVPAIVAAWDGRDPAPHLRAGWSPLPAAPASAEALAGRWAGVADGPIEIVTDGAGLLVRSAQGVTYGLVRISPAAYYVPGLDAWVGARLMAGADELVWRTLEGERRGRRIAGSGR